MDPLKKRVPFHAERVAAVSLIAVAVAVGLALRGENTRTREAVLEKRVVKLEGTARCARVVPLSHALIRLTPVSCPPQLVHNKKGGSVGGSTPQGQPGGPRVPPSRGIPPPTPVPTPSPAPKPPPLPPTPPLPGPVQGIQDTVTGIVNGLVCMLQPQRCQ